MTFRPDAVEAFLRIFDASAPQIRAFPGCLFLELWQDLAHPHLLTTHSHWEDAAALEHYRQSPLFIATWAETKRLFAAPPQAHSHHCCRTEAQIGGRI
jgi:quinol monooxygenase YgiN